MTHGSTGLDYSSYADLGPDHYLRRTKNPARRAARLVDQLRALGYEAILAPAG